MVWEGCDFLSCNDEKRFVTDEPGFSNKILSRRWFQPQACPAYIEKTLLVSLGSYGASPSIAGYSGKFKIGSSEPRLHGPRDLRTVLDGLLQFVAVTTIRVLMSHEEPCPSGGADMLHIIMYFKLHRELCFTCPCTMEYTMRVFATW